MLSVIGLEFYSSAIQGIDQFDYFLYRQQPIIFNKQLNTAYFAKHLLRSLDNLLTGLPLNRADLQLIIIDEIDFKQLTAKLQPLSVNDFASYTLVENLEKALDLANVLALKGLPILLLTLNGNNLDGHSMLLLTDQSHLLKQYQNLRDTHIYAHFDQSDFSQIETLLIQPGVTNDVVNTIATKISTPLLSQTGKNNVEQLKPQTLITTLLADEIASNAMKQVMTVIAAILCLDQRYRLGCHKVFTINPNIVSSFYQLTDSTSFLPSTDKQQRKIAVALTTQNSQPQLIVKSADSSDLNINVSSGFFAQHRNKPIVFVAANEDGLLAQLDRLLALEQQEFCFENYLQQQLHAYQSNSLTKFYALVIVADSQECLLQQVKLFMKQQAINGFHAVWKTPVGSYFAGQLIDNTKECKATFVYPGIGATYLGMGKDLLRLFPACYPFLATLTDNINDSLQDHLITPRLIGELQSQLLAQAEFKLREKLAYIAEAGVSYACLLTYIFEQLLNVKATSAAGYSMGEVSMFAALGCWQQPYLLSQRLRESDVFNLQLSGELQCLDDSWLASKQAANKRWDSFHIKAGLVQVEAIRENFPRVYVTIINTSQSLVIAGAPEQCLAMAKQLGVRAISVDIQNIIHCPLAKTEAGNIQALYSLPVNNKQQLALFSSACYLPIPVTEKALAVSISKCLTEQVDFPRLITAIAKQGENLFIEMGAGKSLTTWIERNLKESGYQGSCLAVNQKNVDDYSMLIKAVAQLISLGQPVNLQPFFSGSLRRTQDIVETHSTL